MRGNRVKEKLEAGEVANIVGAAVNTGDMIDFLGPLGFDGMWLEGEHGPVTWDQMGDLSRACDLWGLTSVLRIQDKTPGRITRALDRGVNGLVIPHVNSKADAEQIVRAARFAPLGERGMFGGRRSYGQADYFKKANDEVLVIVLIEEMRAIEQLADILTVDHIDVFFIAPSDLAQTMGLVGQPWHPKVQDVVKKGLSQIAAAGRVAGTLANDDLMEDFINAGARCFLTSINGWIQSGAKQYLSKVSKLAA